VLAGDRRPQLLVRARRGIEQHTTDVVEARGRRFRKPRTDRCRICDRNRPRRVRVISADGLGGFGHIGPASARSRGRSDVDRVGSLPPCRS
jgi:hypothetical protein